MNFHNHFSYKTLQVKNQVTNKIGNLIFLLSKPQILSLLSSSFDLPHRSASALFLTTICQEGCSQGYIFSYTDSHHVFSLPLDNINNATSNQAFLSFRKESEKAFNLICHFSHGVGRSYSFKT